MGLRLTPSALSVTLSIRNGADRLMPAGLGLHPYFRHEPACEVAYRVSAVWSPNADFIAECRGLRRRMTFICLRARCAPVA